MRNFLIAYLRVLATGVLRARKPEIIVITGSAGKTTTKEAIYRVLVGKYGKAVARSRGNLNTEIGAPLAILGFKFQPPKWLWPLVIFTALIHFLAYYFRLLPYPKILILELATDRIADLKYLASFIKPHISVITNVGPTHLEKFNSIERVAEEKAEILKPLNENDYAVLNFNDSRVKNMAKNSKAKVLWFKDSETSAARAIGRIYGLSFDEIDRALKTFAPLAGRGRVVQTKSGLTLIDETYNANPLSVEWALKRLEKHRGRKVVILGDMLELGAESEKYHQEIAYKARFAADVLILVGPRFATFKADAHFTDSRECAAKIKQIVQKNDIILIKGSRGMKMEKVYENLYR